MAQFINIVHPDLKGQMGRVPRASFPAWADSGWTIAEDDDVSSNPRSKYVELARQEMQEETAELALAASVAADKAAAGHEAMAVALAAENTDSTVEESTEEPEPEPEPKPKPPKPKTGSKK